MSEKKEAQEVIKGFKKFEDERGSIENYELPEKINWVGLIISKKGARRANHYHPEQEQKVILISGKYVSVYKDLSEKDGETKDCLIKKGDLEIIQPNVAHTMIFLEDSVFVNLVNGEREHEKFGQHTIPFKLVNGKEAEKYIEKYSKR